MFKWFTWGKFFAGLGAVAGAVIATPQLGVSGGVLAGALLLQTIASLFTTRAAGTATNAAGAQLNGAASPPVLLPAAPAGPAPATLPPELSAALTAALAALPQIVAALPKAPPAGQQSGQA